MRMDVYPTFKSLIFTPTLNVIKQKIKKVNILQLNNNHLPQVERPPTVQLTKIYCRVSGNSRGIN